jgi:hypothetical protein
MKMKLTSNIFNDLGTCPEDDRWWIGVDLDGTLAHYEGWVSSGHIGEPIPEMMDRVKEWIAWGYRVKIFTARCRIKEQEAPIVAWLEKHGIGGLEITNVKDHKMVELWDDRCVQVVKNTGQTVAGGFSQIEDEVEKG